MAPQVKTRTRDELLARRGELLSRLGVTSVAEAESRARSDELTGEQWHLVDLLRDVAFLLGEE